MARQAQLVCQHLENISSEALDKYQDVVITFAVGRESTRAIGETSSTIGARGVALLS